MFFIAQVSLHPSLHEVTHQADWTTEGDTVRSTGLLDDLLVLLCGGWGEARLGIASEVSHALEELGHHVGVLGVDCQPFHKICLTGGDLQYLLASRREAMYRSGFSQVCRAPSNYDFCWSCPMPFHLASVKNQFLVLN